MCLPMFQIKVGDLLFLNLRFEVRKSMFYVKRKNAPKIYFTKKFVKELTPTSGSSEIGRGAKNLRVSKT